MADKKLRVEQIEDLVTANITDITASAAELNVLDGIPGTLTATELGYVDGVTSAIQTQLDGKQPLDSDLTTIAAANNGSVLAATTASFTTADETKLDGIEALADVTDTANVTAAGALMDSECTNLAAVKAINQGLTTTSDVTFADIQVTGEIYADAEVDDGNSSTADTIDWTTGAFHKSTMTGNCTYTFTAPSGPARLQLKLVQDGTGSRTATWPASVKWPSGTAPTLSTAASAIDIITFYYDGTNYFGVDSLNFS